MLDRRSFLKTSASSVLLACSAFPGCEAGDRGPGPLEGLYVDRFTYRHGENVRIHLALQSNAPINIDLIRIDRSPAVRFARFSVVASTTQELNSPGLLGAGFDVAVEFPASDLPPGLYQGQIDPLRMIPENRVNDWNGFPSRNYVVSFVVTNANPGSRSRILLLHDAITAACYSGFGNRSIYPDAMPHNDVSLERPGIERATTAATLPHRYLHDQGYEFEYIDTVSLDSEAPDFLDAYDLVCLYGTHEYQTHETLVRLAEFAESGGNLLFASDEFAAFRVRVNQGRVFSFKWRSDTEDFARVAADGLEGSNPADAESLRARIAGIGMATQHSVKETELTGQTVWLAHFASPGVSMPLQTVSDPQTDWLLAGTGISPGSPLPSGVRNFATGNILSFAQPEHPVIADPVSTGASEGLAVWGYSPSADGRDWTQANSARPEFWPRLDCHAIASFQNRSSGSQIVTLPSFSTLTDNSSNPIHQQLMMNIYARLQSRA